jgi:hypothetical protein
MMRKYQANRSSVRFKFCAKMGRDPMFSAAFLQNPSLASNIWIGAFAYAGGPFAWTDRSPFSFTYWVPGQPPANPDGCVQVCLKSQSSCVQGKWTVEQCTIQQSFVCTRSLDFDLFDMNTVLIQAKILMYK